MTQEITSVEVALLEDLQKLAKISQRLDKTPTKKFPSHRGKNFFTCGRLAVRIGFRALRIAESSLGAGDSNQSELFDQIPDDKVIGLSNMQTFVEQIGRDVEKEIQADDTGQGFVSESSPAEKESPAPPAAAVRSRLVALDETAGWPTVEDLDSIPDEHRESIYAWALEMRPGELTGDDWDAAPAALKVPTNHGAQTMVTAVFKHRSQRISKSKLLVSVKWFAPELLNALVALRILEWDKKSVVFHSANQHESTNGQLAQNVFLSCIEEPRIMTDSPPGLVQYFPLNDEPPATSEDDLDSGNEDLE